MKCIPCNKGIHTAVFSRQKINDRIFVKRFPCCSCMYIICETKLVCFGALKFNMATRVPQGCLVWIYQHVHSSDIAITQCSKNVSGAWIEQRLCTFQEGECLCTSKGVFRKNIIKFGRKNHCNQKKPITSKHSINMYGCTVALQNFQRGKICGQTYERHMLMSRLSRQPNPVSCK